MKLFIAASVLVVLTFSQVIVPDERVFLPTESLRKALEACHMRNTAPNCDGTQSQADYMNVFRWVPGPWNAVDGSCPPSCAPPFPAVDTGSMLERVVNTGTLKVCMVRGAMFWNVATCTMVFDCNSAVGVDDNLAGYQAWLTNPNAPACMQNFTAANAPTTRAWVATSQCNPTAGVGKLFTDYGTYLSSAYGKTISPEFLVVEDYNDCWTLINDGRADVAPTSGFTKHFQWPHRESASCGTNLRRNYFDGACELSPPGPISPRIRNGLGGPRGNFNFTGVTDLAVIRDEIPLSRLQIPDSVAPFFVEFWEAKYGKGSPLAQRRAPVPTTDPSFFRNRDEDTWRRVFVTREIDGYFCGECSDERPEPEYAEGVQRGSSDDFPEIARLVNAFVRKDCSWTRDFPSETPPTTCPNCPNCPNCPTCPPNQPCPSCPSCPGNCGGGGGGFGTTNFNNFNS